MNKIVTEYRGNYGRRVEPRLTETKANKRNDRDTNVQLLNSLIDVHQTQISKRVSVIPA